MLELHPNCEKCGTQLPPNSEEAMICTYECTFCMDCVEEFQNVCPNCGGGFVSRPVRPKEELIKYPASQVSNVKLFKAKQHEEYLARYKDIRPADR